MPSYTDVTLDHFYNPRNAARLTEADVVGKAGDPERGGPFLLLFLKLDGERIQRATYQTYGCCAVIAAGSVLTEKLQGSTLAEAARIDELAINEALGGLPMEKRHCSALAASALQEALRAVRATPSAQKRTW